MKIIKFVVVGMIVILAGATQAQVSVNVNIGVPPPWGPVGYTDVRYYYLPDVEAYYDIQNSMFICFVQGEWVHRSHLSSQYRNYDLYGGYKVVMTDYHGNAPYADFKEHKMKYGKGYRGPEQKSYGEKPGKGNSGNKKSREGNKDNKEGNHGHDKNDEHGKGNSKK
jgi:hypothetical protein